MPGNVSSHCPTAFEGVWSNTVDLVLLTYRMGAAMPLNITLELPSNVGSWPALSDSPVNGVSDRLNIWNSRACYHKGDSYAAR
jgi:hypothetical protein